MIKSGGLAMDDKDTVAELTKWARRYEHPGLAHGGPDVASRWNDRMFMLKHFRDNMPWNE